MSEKKELGWKDVPIGGIILTPGSSAAYKTGAWRTYRPVVNEKCIHCLTCWVICPDAAVIVEEGKMKGFDYEYCKGCGLCAKHCPPKVRAIEMILEQEAQAVAEKSGSGGGKE